MALSCKPHLISESEPLICSRSHEFDISHISVLCFKPESYDYCSDIVQFCVGSNLWTLQLTTSIEGICCHSTLEIERAQKTDVYCSVSVLEDKFKHFEKRMKLKAIRGQKEEVWQQERDRITEFLRKTSLDDDALTLKVTIELYNPGTVDVYKSSTIGDFKPKRTLNSSVTNLLANNSLTDVTLNVKGKELKAHKVILAAMSPVFEAMFQEGYKEHEDNYVNIQDIDSDVFEVFLRFLYSGEVEKLGEMYLDLFAASDKYDVQPLREICIQHMAKNISVDNAIDLLALADRHSAESIKSLSLQFIKLNFADVVKTKCWASLLENYPHDVKRVCVPVSDKIPLDIAETFRRDTGDIPDGNGHPEMEGEDTVDTYMPEEEEEWPAIGNDPWNPNV
jgi:BTB/POZ domain